MSLTREQKRRRQRIRANLTGLVALSGAMAAGALLGGGAAYRITEPQEPAKATFRPVVVQTVAEPYEEQEEPERVSLGVFTVYAYCPCETCCGQWSGGPTASGVMPEEGRTVAADWDVLPAGAEVYISGVGWRTVEDTGSGVTGNTLDLYMDSHQDALEWGVREIEIFTRAEG